YAAVGGLAGFKGKTNRESVEEYLSNAKNRPQIMAENGIQLDQISDPEEKQALINARGQSAKGAVDLLKKAYNVNGGVETLLGSVAIAESKRVASDVIISTISKIQNDVSNIANEEGYTDYNKVEQIFNSQTDYDNYMAGKTFQFKPEYKVQLEEYTKPLINQATTIIANYNNAAMTSKTYDEFASKINPKVTQDGIPVNTKVLAQSDTTIPSGSPQYDFSFVSTGEPSQTLFEYYKMKDNSNIWDSKNQKFKPNSGQAILEHIQSFDPQGGVLLSRKNSNIANIMVNGGSAGIDSMFDYKGNITPLGIEFLSQKNFETLDVVDQKVWLENIANASIRHQTLFTQNRIKQSRSEGIKTTKPVAIKIGDVQVNVGQKV
ncbi:MAG TPA: hypothetical protein PLP73_04650, partial [Candidatus Absconditabacterales bacterium]|nr:hypothetical protein [Candidatus Absconditabacterales bacterium]